MSRFAAGGKRRENGERLSFLSIGNNMCKGPEVEKAWHIQETDRSMWLEFSKRKVKQEWLWKSIPPSFFPSKYPSFEITKQNPCKAFVNLLKGF